jgi:thermitase
MRRFLCLFLLSAIGGLPLEAAPPPAHVPGRLLVGHRAGIDAATVDRVLQSHGAVVRRSNPALGFTVLEVPESSSQAILAALKRTGLFAYVERDFYAHTSAVPNDPNYGAQWHLPQIHSPEAWSVTTGSASVVVAVVDSGVDDQHPDLASKVVEGWNFVDPNAGTSDVIGHGTAVAGTIAAASNNSIGIAGVNWASRIMPLVVVDSTDFAAYSDIASAFQYAADRGVRVINASVGGPNQSDTLQNAVNYAWNKGAVIFASAMNDSTDSPYYPAACTYVVAVSATDNNDRLASFSNYGNWITLAAPGTNILTTANGGGYSYWNGTSFSAPIVAGVAALSLAVNPALSASALVSLLKQTADDIGPPGFDASFGWGRVNAFHAVSAALPVPPTPAPVSGSGSAPRHPRPAAASNPRDAK